MNKREFAEAISAKTGGTVKDAEKYIKAMTETITEVLANKEELSLVGFGRFCTREMKEREGRNPRNPEEVMIVPAWTAVAFKAGKGLKDAVNK